MTNKNDGYQALLVVCLGLLVILGLSLVELTLQENGQLLEGPLFPRVSIDGPGHYHFFGFRRELEVSLVVNVSQVTQRAGGLWLEVGQWQVYIPLKITLLKLPKHTGN